jgi:hypothetical protein
MSVPIYCCGMMRSGSTVLYQAVSAIIEARGLGGRAGYYEPPNRPAERDGGFAVYKIPWLGDYERQRIADGCYVFYSYREIEEALTSAWSKLGIAPALRPMWRYVVTAHDREMQQIKAARLVPFELWQDMRLAVECIAAMLPGFDLEKWQLDRIAADLALPRQKARPKVYPMDPHTLLTPHHFGN